MDRPQIPSTISQEQLEELLFNVAHSGKQLSLDLTTVLSDASGISTNEFRAKLSAYQKEIDDENINEHGVGGGFTSG